MLARDTEHIFTGKHKATRLNQIKSACNVPFFCCIANKLYTMGTSKNSVRFLEVSVEFLINEKINLLTLSPVERKLYESRMKLKSDIATISEDQFNAGREEGKLEGKLETARILKQLGDPVQKIMQVTGLSQAEVEALK